MNNNIIRTIVVAASSVLAAVSCDLSEYPYGFYSDANFYKTPEDAESAMMYAYNALTNLEYSRGIFYIGEAASETVALKSGEDANNPGAQALDEWQIADNANNQTLQVYFKYCYVAINRANAVIKNVENNTFLDDALKIRLLGEAHFLRAYSHFSLVKVFGLVPLQRHMVETVDNTTPAMAKNMDEVYDFMIEDLKIAEANLDYTRKVGRANKAAAQAFLAKLYLTAASSKESGVKYYADMRMSADDMYSEAAGWAKKVLDASETGQAPFGLASTLQEIYDVDRPDGSEHIFIMSMDRTGQNEGNYSKIGMLFMPYNNGSDFYVKTGGNLVASHFGYEVFPTNSAFYDSYDASDKRKTELMGTEIFSQDGSSLGQTAYAYTTKYIDPHQVSESTGDKSSVKPYLMRFTEVALIYAEAMGSDEGGWVSKIRARAGLGPLASGMDKDQFRDAVVQERAWELAFEGNRLYDLRRKAIVTREDPNAQAAGITEEQAAFYPIPQREVDLNPNL